MVDITIDNPVVRDDGTVSIKFSATEGPYTLNDAFGVTQEQYNAMTPEQLASELQRRWDNWLETVLAPPVYIAEVE